MRAVSGKKNKIDPAQDKAGRTYRGHSQGSLSIVGIGPGARNLLSPAALKAIRKSEVIVGYKTYIELLGGLVAGKEVVSLGMKQELKRAGLAIKAAKEGKQVSLISSGDPGIYGMAGPALELLSEPEKEKIKIEIIPGVIAATSSAGLLGAPLMHDFAVISLSDLLTGLKTIIQRIIMACRGDFVIVFYNPRSKTRTKPLEEAWKILMKHRPHGTPVGIVRSATRKNEEVMITKLEDMLMADKIDMATTIIVGNSKTYIKGKFMITPRGYKPLP